MTRMVTNSQAGAPGRREFLGMAISSAAAVLASAPASAAPANDVVARVRSLTATGEAYWEAIRREFRFANDLVYLNCGTLGPMPLPVVEARAGHLRRMAEDPRAPFDIEAVRAKAAVLVGADVDEVVLTRSTTEGMKLFCAGLGLRPGDEVLMSTHEHEGGAGPWRVRAARHGVVVREIEVSAPVESVDQLVSLFESAITPKTRVLLVSYPIFVTGVLMPIKELAELAHRKGLLISVDGAHSLGMLKLNLHELGVDHYAGSGHKWLMAGSGTGVSYVKRAIQPQVLADMPQRDRATGARQYEQSGTRDVAGVAGMEVAIDFQQAIGPARVESRVRELAEYLRRGLGSIPGVSIVTPRTPALSGGLTTFTLKSSSSAATRKHLLDTANIYITGSRLNVNSCRVSTHFYTLRSEIDRLVGALRRLVESSAA